MVECRDTKNIVLEQEVLELDAVWISKKESLHRDTSTFLPQPSRPNNQCLQQLPNFFPRLAIGQVSFLVELRRSVCNHYLRLV